MSALDAVQVLIDECEYPTQQGVGPSDWMIKEAAAQRLAWISELCELRRRLKNYEQESLLLVNTVRALQDQAKRVEAQTLKTGRQFADWVLEGPNLGGITILAQTLRAQIDSDKAPEAYAAAVNRLAVYAAELVLRLAEIDPAGVERAFKEARAEAGKS